MNPHEFSILYSDFGGKLYIVNSKYMDADAVRVLIRGYCLDRGLHYPEDFRVAVVSMAALEIVPRSYDVVNIILRESRSFLDLVDLMLYLNSKI